MKKYLLGLLTGLIITSITAYAVIKYQANEIEYNDTTVESALNDLYTIHSTYKHLTSNTTASSSDILNGKTAYNSNGELITGSNTDSNLSYEVWSSGTFTNSTDGTAITKTISVPSGVKKVRIYVSVSSTWGSKNPTITGNIVTSSSIDRISLGGKSGNYDSKFFEVIVNTNGNAGSIDLNINIAGEASNTADAVIIYEK